MKFTDFSWERHTLRKRLQRQKPCGRQMIDLVRLGGTPEEPSDEFEPAVRSFVDQAKRDAAFASGARPVREAAGALRPQPAFSSAASLQKTERSAEIRANCFAYARRRG